MRAVSLRTGKLYLERAILHLYLLELVCNIKVPAQEHKTNEEAEEFQPRRNTSEIARVRLNNLTNDVTEGPFNE